MSLIHYTCATRGRGEDLEPNPIVFSERTCERRIAREKAIKNSKGEIRTLDLTGMSRALSPAELPCHIFLYVSVAGSSAALTKIYNFVHCRSLGELPCHKFKLFTCHLSILSQTFLNFK